MTGIPDLPRPLVMHTAATLERIAAARRQPRKLPPRRGVLFDVGDRVRLRGTSVVGLVEQVGGVHRQLRIVRWDPDRGEQAGVREIVPATVLAEPRGAA